jgi:ATP-dependent Clp protease ATP-binding subunit ClpX
MLPRPVYVRCSFCGRAKEQVKQLIGGPRGVAICDQCVELCSEILKDAPPDPRGIGECRQ